MRLPFLKLSIWVFPLLLAVPTTSLMCFSCQSSKPFSDCESNVRELTKGVHSKYAVNCTEYKHMAGDFCAIESYIQGGEVIAMIRDCNDGKFSYTKDNYPYLKMKHLNGRSNITVCVYTRGRVECTSLCNTDMCNGPSSIADSLHGTSYFTLLSLSYLTSLALLF